TPVLYLASDHASFITGTTMVVDGGMSIVDATAREIHSR
ncbi:MAG: SDR family oxidoreductase, partial [Chloroflexi bacterium]|nr:SDR family oxidoreductase [Chloroflexota bacterium]